MTSFSMQDDENNQDVLEFENNLERISRDLVTDVLTRARCMIAHESPVAEQNKYELAPQSSTLPTPQLLSPTESTCPKKDNALDEYADSCLISPTNQTSVTNEDIQTPNTTKEDYKITPTEDLNNELTSSERKLTEQYSIEFDFRSNVLNDFRGIGVGSATPDTPRQTDCQWKSSTEAATTKSSICTPLYCHTNTNKPIYLREVSPSPPTVSSTMIEYNSNDLSKETMLNPVSECPATCRMLTYRQDSPTVINTIDIEEKLKPFSSPLPIYVPSTACTRILKSSDIKTLTNNYNPLLNRIRDTDIMSIDLSYHDKNSVETSSTSSNNDNYITSSKQKVQPNVPRLHLPLSPKLKSSSTHDQIRKRNPSLTRNNTENNKTPIPQIAKSTSSSLCWWEPLNCTDVNCMRTKMTTIAESQYKDKFYLPEPNPEVIRHYHYLCDQQAMKEALLIKAIKEAENKAKYDKIAHYELLRQKSRNNKHNYHQKQIRFINSHQSRKDDLRINRFNKVNNKCNNRANLTRPENFIHLLQKENKPKNNFSQFSNEEDSDLTVRKSCIQRSVLSSTSQNVSY
ncbi:unnamed protein product [Trichobilharzia szidati]|nr:unnamed protein product [Trichobilharzia szidati]